MRQFILVVLALSVLGSARPAVARTPSADALIRERGLGHGEACLVFVNTHAVDHRKDRWRAVIDELWTRDPQIILDWIVGAAAPPRAAIEEASKQRDCLIGLLVHDAADPSTRLILDYQKQSSDKGAMAALGARYAAARGFREQLHRTLTESDHRDAHTQSWIWKRKFVFSGRNFNYVSPHAARRCGIEPNQSWKPDSSSHRECWTGVLTPAEREREILQASAAPGISRHHWGSDFDFFGLNPQLFRTGRHADEYLWMTHNAVHHGFFQPYTSREIVGERYMEERWHWSYYPIGQALLEFAALHTAEVGERLEELWRDFESRWSARGANETYFGFVRAHWKEFMFNVDTSIIKADGDGRGARRASAP